MQTFHFQIEIDGTSIIGHSGGAYINELMLSAHEDH